MSKFTPSEAPVQKRGRKPGIAEVPPEPDFNQPYIDSAMEVMRQTELAKEQEAFSETFDLGCFVGAAQMASAMGSFCEASQIRAFSEIKKSKAFKHIAINHPNGELRISQNIDEFCRAVFKRGYRVMQDDEGILQRLGGAAFDALNSLGISRGQMRLLISLPEDERAAVAEAVKSGEKSEVVSLIQDLANKLDETRQKVDELKAEDTANKSLLAERAKKVDALEAKLKRAVNAEPDTVGSELRDVVNKWMNDALGAIQGNFRLSIQQLLDYEATQRDAGVALDSKVWLAGVFAQVADALNTERGAFFIPDVGAVAKRPEWLDFSADVNQASIDQ